MVNYFDKRLQKKQKSRLKNNIYFIENQVILPKPV